jgi:hypothetical protein
MSPTGFDPAFPAIERPQTYALGLKVTGIGRSIISFPFIKRVIKTFAAIFVKRTSLY